nr:ribokinase [Anaerolineae bacterium]
MTGAGPRLGGTVTFCALMARCLGIQVGILTSAPSAISPLLQVLEGIPLIPVPAEEPTTFINTYTDGHRQQMLLGRAMDIAYDHLPPEWRIPSVVHFAPVINEIPLDLIHRFPASLRCATPQGWMRQWDRSGKVTYKPWDKAQDVLPLLDVVITSIEDLQDDEETVLAFATSAPLLVVTRARQGCTVYVSGKPHHIHAPSVTEIDPTGAGDIFAISFMARYQETGDPLQAARFATLLASDSITREGLDSIPDQGAVWQARKLS